MCGIAGIAARHGGQADMEQIKQMIGCLRHREKGYFKADAVKKMIAKGKGLGSMGEVEEMALAGILSVQLLDDLFVRQFDKNPENNVPDEVTLFTQGGTTPAG